MKLEGRIFLYTAFFCFIMAVVYAVWSKFNTFNHRIEPVGLVALLLTGGLCLIIGTFFEFVARRLEQPRPEDNPRAEISDGAGEVGFFSPGSYWPVACALAAAVGGVAIAFWMVWLIVIAIIMILIMVGGLVFEYHIGPNRD